MRRKLLLLFTLYFCQGLPGGFLAVVVPVILREQGTSLTMVGVASLLSLPWLAKVSWAPLVDRYGSRRFGRRRSWLVPAQLGMIAVCLALATLRPEDRLPTIAVLFLVLNVLAATQDIAVDGWAVDMLEPHELGPGNGAQIAGFKMGNLFGGGVLLAASASIGWQGDFLIMSGCLALAVVLVLRTPEAPPRHVDERAPTLREVLGRVVAATREQGPWLWIFLVYAKFGETFGGAMVEPMLVDRGYSRELIGWVDGVVGGIATIVGAALGGLLCRRWGWARTLATFSVVQGLALSSIGVYQQGGMTVTGIATLLAVENFGGGGVGVAVFALSMSLCRRDVGATQFTAMQVIYMSGAALAAPAAGMASDLTGFLPVMTAGGVMAVILAGVALTRGPRLGVSRPGPVS